MNGIFQAENEMRQALERLSSIWAHLRTEWEDNAQRHFDSAYITPALNGTPELLVLAQQLAALIDQARDSVE